MKINFQISIIAIPIVLLVASQGCAPRQTVCRCVCETAPQVQVPGSEATPRRESTKPSDNRLKLPAVFDKSSASGSGASSESLSSIQACPGEVRFKDKGMERAVRMLLKKPDGAITGKEVSSIEQFSNGLLGNDNYIAISDLSGIECLVSLTRVDLRDSSVTDLSPLKNLPHLTHLKIENGRIRDMKSLAGFNRLEALNLWNNRIADLSGFPNLPTLKTLLLNQNEIVDASPLGVLAGLESLSLEVNRIADLSFVKSLTKLKRLSLWQNKISNIGAVRSLTQLTSLSLGKNKFSDISPLVDALPNLQELRLSENPIKDLSPLVRTLGGGILDITGIPIDCKKDRELLENISIRWTERFVDCPEFSNGV